MTYKLESFHYCEGHSATTAKADEDQQSSSTPPDSESETEEVEEKKPEHISKPGHQPIQLQPGQYDPNR